LSLRSPPRLGIQLGAAAALLALHQLAVGTPLERTLGFRVLRWEETRSCSPEITARRLPGSGPIVRNAPGQISCGTQPLRLPAALLEIEYAGKIPAGDAFDLAATLAGREVFRVGLLRPRRNAWTRQKIRLPAALLGREVALHLHARSANGPAGRLALRDRISFTAPASPPEELLRPLRTPAGRAATSLLLAASLGLLWVTHAARLSRGGPFLALLLLAALGIQLRTAPFFVWDEWIVLHRFAREGPRAVVAPHNEHFLPLFFSVYYLEARLFGDRYLLHLLASLLVHVVDALLLGRLLAAVAARLPGGAIAARLLAFLFLIAAVHAEVLQWAFGLCIPLAQGAALVSLNGAWDYATRGSRRSLWACGAGAAAAPLFFGNGFAVALQLPAIAALAAALAERPARRFAPRIPALAAVTLLAVGIPALAYGSAGERPTGWLSSGAADLLRQPGAIASYAVSGSQAGTVLRGLGMLPVLGPEGASQRLPDWIPGVPPAFAAPLLGSLVSLFLLLAALSQRGHRRAALWLWLAGQWILLASYALPALARFELSILQSLALRYTYGAFPGLLLCLLVPFAGSFGSSAGSGGEIFRRKGILFAGLFLFVAVQLQRGAAFDELAVHGARNRSFVAELVEWNALLGSGARGGPSLRALRPSPPRELAPGIPANRIYAALHWLDPGRYPPAPPEPRP